MSRSISRVNSGKWIRLDTKRQSNSKELIALVKTINGVQVKKQNNYVYVCFPDDKPASARKVTLEKTLRSFASISKSSKKEDATHHYSAVMLK